MNKKKGALLFQVGSLILLIFAIIILFTQRYVFKQSTEIYLNAKMEMIDHDLTGIIEKIKPNLSKAIINYTCSHPKEVRKSLTANEVKELIDSRYYIDDFDVEKEFDSFSDKIKLALCKDSRNTLSWLLSSEIESRGYVDAYCISPTDVEGKYCVISDLSLAYSLGTNTDAFEIAICDFLDPQYSFGEIIDFNTDDIEGLSEAINNTETTSVFHKKENQTDNKVLFIGYKPIYNDAGEFMTILCVEYDWTDVYTSLIEKSSARISTNLLVGLLLAAAIILLCLYLLVIKPLKKVEESVDIYMDTKDSAAVEKNLSNLKSRNEIGFLADDFRELAFEIDRYTDENISLTAEGTKVKTELDMAASIQRQSLIKDFPKSERYKVFASMTPARDVGGDFYDIFDIDKDHTAFVIADVSGKGMPAALFMMAAMTTIKNYTMTCENPAEALYKANNDIVKKDVMGMFVTVWLGILDKNTGLLTTCNAGHEYPVICRNGKFEMLVNKHGLVVGAMEDYKYKNFEIQLNEGDSIFVYTDGVPEATDGKQEMFGCDRLLEVLNKEPDAAPEKMLTNVKAAVDDFVGEAEQFDDLTMMYMIYK